MGLIRRLHSTYRKSEAAVVVRSLLDIQRNASLLEEDPAKLANLLVARAWEEMPDILNGKFGRRPYKITVAALALANGLSFFRSNNPLTLSLMISLATLLAKIEKNGAFYPLNNADFKLVDMAIALFEEKSDELKEMFPTLRIETGIFTTDEALRALESSSLRLANFAWPSHNKP